MSFQEFKEYNSCFFYVKRDICFSVKKYEYRLDRWVMNVIKQVKNSSTSASSRVIIDFIEHDIAMEKYPPSDGILQGDEHKKNNYLYRRAWSRSLTTIYWALLVFTLKACIKWRPDTQGCCQWHAILKLYTILYSLLTLLTSTWSNLCLTFWLPENSHLNQF